MKDSNKENEDKKNSSINEEKYSKSNSFDFSRSSLCKAGLDKNNSNNYQYNYPLIPSIRNKKYTKKIEVGVGIGIFLVDIKEKKLLIGKRVEGEVFGLPGGWLEHGEEFEETASRELKEETGLLLANDRFKHISTLNCIFSDKGFHNISIVMYCEIQSEEERDQITNREPSKCRGWFWTTIEKLRENYDKLFYPIRTMLSTYPQLLSVDDFLKLR